MTKYSNRDHYVDPTTGVLYNKLGITDATILEKQEADYAAARSNELAENPINGRFDLAHLQAIHERLFCDLYPWAGQLRDIDISKGDMYFAHHRHIASAARQIFDRLAEEHYLAGLDASMFSDRAAQYLGEINALHPFREGNGRAQREFISQLACKNGWRIDWKNVAQQDMIQASIESFKGDCSKFAAYIKANIRKL